MGLRDRGLHTHTIPDMLKLKQERNPAPVAAIRLHTLYRTC